MAECLIVGSQPLSIEQIESVARRNMPVKLAEEARTRIQRGRQGLEAALDRGDRIYGVNTGVGGNIVFSLRPDQAELLQHNLMRHLSCATGQPLPEDAVRAAVLLRLVTFSTGCSAVREQLVEALVRFLNSGITPVIVSVS